MRIEEDMYRGEKIYVDIEAEEQRYEERRRNRNTKKREREEEKKRKRGIEDLEESCREGGIVCRG